MRFGTRGSEVRILSPRPFQDAIEEFFSSEIDTDVGFAAMNSMDPSHSIPSKTQIHLNNPILWELLRWISPQERSFPLQLRHF